MGFQGGDPFGIAKRRARRRAELEQHLCFVRTSAKKVYIVQGFWRGPGIEPVWWHHHSVSFPHHCSVQQWLAPTAKLLGAIADLLTILLLELVDQGSGRT